MDNLPQKTETVTKTQKVEVKLLDGAAIMNIVKPGTPGHLVIMHRRYSYLILRANVVPVKDLILYGTPTCLMA